MGFVVCFDIPREVKTQTSALPFVMTIASCYALVFRHTSYVVQIMFRFLTTRCCGRRLLLATLKVPKSSFSVISTPLVAGLHV